MIENKHDTNQNRRDNRFIMTLVCAHCEGQSVYVHESAQESICHDCGTVTPFMGVTDMYTDIIDPAIRSTMSSCLERIYTQGDVADYECVHDAQRVYNAFPALTRKEACVLTLCANRPIDEQHSICASVAVCIRHIQPYLASTATSHVTMYSDIVFRHMRQLVAEHDVVVKYPILTNTEYISPQRLAFAQVVKQFPELETVLVHKKYSLNT